MEELFEIIKILLPSVVVLYGVYLTVKTFLQKRFEESLAIVREKSQETSLPLRLQAYERLAIYLERMAPQSLLVRLTDASLTVGEFQHILINEIQTEFNHNLSQQIYVSDEAWDMVRQAKENLLSGINFAVKDLDENETSIALSKRLVEYALNDQTNFVEMALRFLKKEVRELF